MYNVNEVMTKQPWFKAIPVHAQRGLLIGSLLDAASSELTDQHNQQITSTFMEALLSGKDGGH